MSSQEPAAFPPYSYVPGGRWPHPTASPEGHSRHRQQRPVRTDRGRQLGGFPGLPPRRGPVQRGVLLGSSRGLGTTLACPWPAGARRSRAPRPDQAGRRRSEGPRGTTRRCSLACLPRGSPLRGITPGGRALPARTRSRCVDRAIPEPSPSILPPTRLRRAPRSPSSSISGSSPVASQTMTCLKHPAGPHRLDRADQRSGRPYASGNLAEQAVSDRVLPSDSLPLTRIVETKNSLLADGPRRHSGLESAGHRARMTSGCREVPARRLLYPGGVCHFPVTSPHFPSQDSGARAGRAAATSAGSVL